MDEDDGDDVLEDMKIAFQSFCLKFVFQFRFFGSVATGLILNYDRKGSKYSMYRTITLDGCVVIKALIIIPREEIRDDNGHNLLLGNFLTMLITSAKC